MFRIINKPITVQKRLNQAIFNKFRESGIPPKLNKNVLSIIDELRDILKEALFQSPEFLSLMTGTLRKDFGLSDEKIVELPFIIRDLATVYYEIEIEDKKLVVRFSIDTLGDDNPYGISALNRASYISPKSGELIDWLRWLIYEGTTKINQTHRVKTLEGKGRSHMGVMIIDKGNNGFSVDPQFAGVAGSNFVSRSILAAWPNLKERLAQHV